MNKPLKVRFLDYMMWVSFALIIVHLNGYKPDDVFWEVYYKFVHDLIIICFSLTYAYQKNTHPLGSLTGIGFASYFCAPIMIRLYLAIEYFENYKDYRKSLTDGHYNILLLFVIFVILLTIYLVKLYYADKGKRIA